MGRNITLVTPLLRPVDQTSETPARGASTGSGSPGVSPRLRLARGIGRSAAALSRTTRLGSGTTIGGRVTLAVEPGRWRSSVGVGCWPA